MIMIWHFTHVAIGNTDFPNAFLINCPSPIATALPLPPPSPIFFGKLYNTARDRRRQFRVVSISPIDGRCEADAVAKLIEFSSDPPNPPSFETSLTETRKKTTLLFSFLIGTISSWHWTTSLPRWNLHVSLNSDCVANASKIPSRMACVVFAPHRKRIEHDLRIKLHRVMPVNSQKPSEQ